MTIVDPALSGVVGGWTLYAHPLFLDQLELLTAAVERAAKKNPMSFAASADAKVLAAIHRLMFEVIPIDPARPEFRQGGTLGSGRKHWFRAKFGGGRFRLFFRFSTSAKIIIFAWVNDRDTLRTYGAKTDAYAVFKAMLDKGNPPEDWAMLMAQSAKLGKS
jgi:toxin YhaV